MTISAIFPLLLFAAVLAYIIWSGNRETESVTLYYAVDADGTACLYTRRPQRDTTMLVWTPDGGRYVEADGLKGILPPLTWADEPIMVSLSPSGRSDLNTPEA